MKRILWVLSCALFILCATSCQKDVSDDLPSQNGADTLPVHVSLKQKDNSTGQTENIAVDYTFSNGKVTKFATNFGDTLNGFTYDDKGYLTGYIDKASYGGVVFQSDTYKISYGANAVIVEDTWHDEINGGSDELTTTVYTLEDSLIIQAAYDFGGHQDVVKYTYNQQGNVIKEEHSYRNEVRTYTYDVNYKNPFFIKGNLIFTAITGGDGTVMSTNMLATENLVYTDENDGQQKTKNFIFTVNGHIGSYPTKVHADGPITDDYVFTYNF